MRRPALLLGALAAAATLASATELRETVDTAMKSFLEGRYEDASSGFRYVSTLGVQLAEPEANLALCEREQGKVEAALPLWLRATLAEKPDGFVWNQRAWSYLALDRTQDARTAFLTAIDRSSTTATQAEAYLGLGIAALMHGDPRAAMDPLRSALVQGPFVLPEASRQTGLTALARRDLSAAMAYLRQSVELEPFGLEALEELAKLYEKIGDPRAAWRVYHRIVSLEPDHARASDKTKKLVKFIQGDPEAGLPLRRLSRPLLDAGGKGSLAPTRSSETIRVSLFAGREGTPHMATRAYFMSNAPFRIVALSGDVVKFDGRPQEQWEVLFRPEAGVVEVRDGARNIQYTAKQAFQILPEPPYGSVLLKSVKFLETFGFDAGDREVRGALEFQPTPDGFTMANELALESYLYGAVGAALPQGSPVEAYKAQAVVSRTVALWGKAFAKPTIQRTHLCDSDHCQRYAGVNEEMREATKGVAATEGLVLATKGERLARVAQHLHCGGRTESGAGRADATLADLVAVDDAASPAAQLRAPVDLERWTHEFPTRDSYCEAGGLHPQVQSRWMRVLDGEDIRRRVEKVKPVGTIKRLRVVRRSGTGRVLALEAIGVRGSVMLEGDEAIYDALSPSSLRSTMFTIQPIKGVGGTPRFVLWGAGTGHGLGFCKAGAVGQGALGRDYQKILSAYFPRYQLDDHLIKTRRPVDARAPGAPRKPKNPKFKKK